MIKGQGNIIGVSSGVTINLGDFNSARFDAWIQKEVKEGEDQKEVFVEIWKKVDKELNKQIEEVQRRRL